MGITDKNKISKPPWLKVKARFDGVYREVKELVDEMGLHTVCQEATCPNIGECFSARTATFIILGDICTRGCRFCDVKKGRPDCYDTNEPARVAEACAKLNMKFAVITSVTRDDLPDGGAAIFAETARSIKSMIPSCGVELLIPDLKGNREALKIILDSNPDVLAHNIETVPRLYDRVRPGADYNRTLNIIKWTAETRDDIIAKSGIMVGLGETREEILEVIGDVADRGCQIMTVGQYLRPSEWHLPVEKYYTPDEFSSIKEDGESLGMKYIEAGPLVRSSYMAHRQLAFYRHKID
jgi:lipoic acid synthetase